MLKCPDIPPARRVGVLLQAALLALNLLAGPALHRKHCNGPCCVAHRLSESHAGPHRDCCGGSDQGERPKSDDGCQCLDDCCSILAYSITPDVVSDTAPATLVSSTAEAVLPTETPRAPAARLLPYPTGPPPVA
ncbi:MAG TPA: hypothetical protein VID50_11750 [Candidatus Eisenbacteria bacterium]